MILYYFLSGVVFLLGIIKIMFDLQFPVLLGGFFALGIGVVLLGRGRFSLYIFVFLLPFINSIPALVGGLHPSNYYLVPLFLLSGMILASMVRDLIRKDKIVFEDFGVDQGFFYYRIFLVFLFVSALFLFLRWSNITLGYSPAFGGDTPAAPPIPRLTPEGHLAWHEQRISFALIFPIVTLFIYFIAPYIYGYIKRMKGDESSVFNWLSYGFYISVFIGIIQKITGQSFLSDRIGKNLKQFNGGFSDFNAFGVFSGIMFLWATYELKRKNIVGYFTLGISLVGSILSGSRTSFVFIIAGIAHILYDTFKDRGKYKKLIAVALIGIVVITIITVGGTLKKRLMGADWDKKDTLFDKLDAVVNGRLKMGAFSLKIIRDYALIGLGTGNYTFYLGYRQYSEALRTQKPYLYDLPLNQYMWVLVENGIFAFLFFTGFMLLLYRRSSKKLLTGTLLVVLLFNNFFWFPEAYLLFWILVAFTYNPNAGAFKFKRVKSKTFKRWIIPASLGVFMLVNILSISSLHPATWARKTGTLYYYGLSYPEMNNKGRAFRWTGERAGYYLTLNRKGKSPRYVISSGIPVNTLTSEKQSVRIYWKRKLIKEEIFSSEDASFFFSMRAKPFEQGFLEFVVSPVYNKAKMKLGKDKRNLGVKVEINEYY